MPEHEKKKGMSKGLQFGLVIGGVIFLLIIGSIYLQSAKPQTSESLPTQKTTTPTPTAVVTKTETPKADTSLLNATVKKAYDVPGIEITNNESVQWDECKLVLNSDYKRTINNPLQPNDPLNNPYALFTKSDGTKFDYTKIEPKSVLIECKVNGSSRQNVYMF